MNNRSASPGAVEQFQANYLIIHIIQSDPGPSYKNLTLTLLQKQRYHFSKKVNNTESLNNWFIMLGEAVSVHRQVNNFWIMVNSGPEQEPAIPQGEVFTDDKESPVETCA